MSEWLEEVRADVGAAQNIVQHTDVRRIVVHHHAPAMLRALEAVEAELAHLRGTGYPLHREAANRVEQAIDDARKGGGPITNTDRQ